MDTCLFFAQILRNSKVYFIPKICGAYKILSAYVDMCLEFEATWSKVDVGLDACGKCQ